MYNIWGTSQKITNHKSATANKHKNEMWERSNIFCDLLPYGGIMVPPPRRRRTQQSANMMCDKSMSFKLDNIIVFTYSYYLLAM